jgi:hypothetical protein
MTPSQLEALRQKAGTLRVEAQEAYKQDRAPIALNMLVEATEIEDSLREHHIQPLPAPIAPPYTPYQPTYPWNPEKEVEREERPLKGKSLRNGRAIGQKEMPAPQALFNF